jgi:hypothetical protein
VDELYIEPNIARGETSKILNVLALNVWWLNKSGTDL